jgi:alpha-1,3-rhamnosyl/mannosyltransferase
MRLAFNATALLSPLTGIGHYSLHLAQELLKCQSIESHFFYGAFWDKRLHARPSPIAKSLPWLRRHLPYSYQLRRLAQNISFGQQARRSHFDVYHDPNIIPLRFSGRTVVTVHDLSWIRHPETHPVERVRAMNRYFSAGLAQADRVITDSVFVKQELVDVMGVAAERISAIPLGVEALFNPMQAADTYPLLERHGLKHGRYFLAVGTLEPRKNLMVALRAYQKLPAATRQHFPMVLIGMNGWHMSALQKQMQQLESAGQLRQLGYLSRPDLATVMAGATALIYPSIYEGFGLPPLEAMACGVPVICANNSSLPEVVGDAGLLVDPHDESSLAQMMLQLADDDSLRSSLAERARERATQFTWARCAEQTIDVYRSLTETEKAF